MTRAVHASLAPTIFRTDVLEAARLLRKPSSWIDGPARHTLEQTLAGRVGVAADRVLAVDSGRHALQLILESLALQPHDAVFLQAYTCVSVPGPVLWAGARPVYVDIIPETYTMDPDDLERKITSALREGLRPRALIIQHTFGLPADIDSLLTIAQAHRLYTIEDSAHALGATYRGTAVGIFGDAAVFSFGRDKSLSSVFGGALVMKDTAFITSLRTRLAVSDLPARAWIFQQLVHPILASAARETYWQGGRYALRVLQSIGILSKALSAGEKRGGPPPWKPHRLSNALAQLALHQLHRLDAFNRQRQTLAQHYTESLRDVRAVGLPFVPGDRTHTFLRYTIRVPNPALVHAIARRVGILLGNWYSLPVDPRQVDAQALRYEPGSCPQAEAAARETVNLPTSPVLSLADADRVLVALRTMPSLSEKRPP